MYGLVRQARLLYVAVRLFCVPAADSTAGFTLYREMLHGAHKQRRFLRMESKTAVQGVYGNFEVHSSFLIRRRIDHLNAHKPPHPLTADMDIVGGLYIVKPLILCKLGADTVG